MNQFYLLRLLLCHIIVRRTTSNVELQTQQGVIYGRQTQISIEYLGCGILVNFIDYCFIFFLVFNMRQQLGGDHQLILQQKCSQMVH